MTEAEEETTTITSLSRVLKGTGLIIVGTVISVILSFLTKILIARFYDVYEYGLYSLSFTILNIAGTVSLLGIQSYLPRLVSYEKPKNPDKAYTAISTAIGVVFISSMLVSAVIFVYAPTFARVLHAPQMTVALKVLVIGLPPMALMNILIAGSRGHGRAREMFYYNYLAYYSIYFILVAISSLLKLPVIYLFVFFTVTQISVLAALVIDSLSKRIIVPKPFNKEIARELVRYSIPLFISTVIGLVLTWSDTLMIGYFGNERLVGFYRAATPFARLLTLFVGAVSYMYLPIASEIYSLGDIRGFKRVYQVLSKWIFLATIPFFSLFFVYPGAVIGLVFGPKYYVAAEPLRILSIGFLIRATFGLANVSLIAIKDTEFIMYSTLGGAIANVLLNYFLIPLMGINGAAVATSISISMVVIMNLVRLLKKSGLHPFTTSFIKPIIISSLLIGAIMASGITTSSIWVALLILTAFLASYGILVVFSRSIEKEDIEILEKIERKLDISLEPLINFLRKHVES